MRRKGEEVGAHSAERGRGRRPESVRRWTNGLGDEWVAGAGMVLPRSDGDDGRGRRRRRRRAASGQPGGDGAGATTGARGRRLGGGRRRGSGRRRSGQPGGVDELGFVGATGDEFVKFS